MQPYNSSTEYSTAACSLMLIINHLNKKLVVSKENEFLIWKESILPPTRASSIYGLAIIAKKYGLEPQIIVENKEYTYPDYRFKRHKKQHIEDAKYMSELYRKKTEEDNISVQERKIPFSEVLTHIENGKVLLIRLNEGHFRSIGSTSRYLVVYGKEGTEYLLVDPCQKTPLLRVQEEELQIAYETLESKKKRDHKMIIF